MMNEPLFIFSADGMASESSTYRTGARHALMLYAKGYEITSARAVAVARAESSGWVFLNVKREKEIDTDLSVIEDAVLRTAVEEALTSGSSVVVYADELALDS